MYPLDFIMTVKTTTRKRTTTRRSSAKAVETSQVAPQPNLTLKDYVNDFKSRVEVHNYEWKKACEDVKSAYDFLLPYGKQTWEFSVGTYQSVKGFIDSQVESSETE